MSICPLGFSPRIMAVSLWTLTDSEHCSCLVHSSCSLQMLLGLENRKDSCGRKSSGLGTQTPLAVTHGWLHCPQTAAHLRPAEHQFLS